MCQQMSEDDWRTHVQRFPSKAEFPFGLNEPVWIVHPSLRAPLGGFKISKALPDDKFELVRVADGAVYHEPVERRFLSRDPFTMTT